MTCTFRIEIENLSHLSHYLIHSILYRTIRFLWNYALRMSLAETTGFQHRAQLLETLVFFFFFLFNAC